MNGDVRRNTFSCPERLMQNVTEEFINPIRDETHYKLNRSGLIQVFFEIALEAKNSFKCDEVFDKTSFKRALKEALAE